MQKACVLLSLALIIGACSNKEEPAVSPPASEVNETEISTEVHSVAENSSNEVWIDVRSVGEFQSGAIEGAANIPHDVIGTRIAELTTDKNAAIRLYCRSGGRAGTAKGVLEKMGYTNVVNEGGYKDLIKRGMTPAKK